MRRTFCLVILSLVLFIIGCNNGTSTGPDDHPAFLLPQEMIGEMMRGINLGNTLEPDTEGGWNAGPAQEYYFDDYKSAGFDCVRIPVKWGSHTEENYPFMIEPAWLNRVEEVVDWGLARGLYIIINAHHEGWLKDDYSEFNKARFDSIWTQVSERFQGKSGQLLFEMINEPHGLTIAEVNDLNFRILSIIRQTNPKRMVVFSGHDYSNLSHMMQAAVPPDDYVMAYYHSYDPWNFGGEGQGTWGSAADRAAMRDKYETASAWSRAWNIPVMIGEFGAVHACDYNSRMMHYFYNVEYALTNGIAFQVWDDDGDFGIYQREERIWPEEKDILIHAYPESPTLLHSTLEGDSVVVLSWQNRTPDASQIAIQRRMRATNYTDIAQLAGDAIDYRDRQVASQEVYFYRVIATDGGVDKFSYPHRVHVYSHVAD